MRESERGRATTGCRKESKDALSCAALLHPLDVVVVVVVVLVLSILFQFVVVVSSLTSFPKHR